MGTVSWQLRGLSEIALPLPLPLSVSLPLTAVHAPDPPPFCRVYLLNGLSAAAYAITPAIGMRSSFIVWSPPLALVLFFQLICALVFYLLLFLGH